MPALKDLTNSLKSVNEATYDDRVVDIIFLLAAMEADQKLKAKLKNDNWLAENVLIVLYTVPELMTRPRNNLLKKFCLQLHPTKINLPDYILEEFI